MIQFSMTYSYFVVFALVNALQKGMKANMKNNMIKRILAMALILVMCLGCTLNAFATESSSKLAVTSGCNMATPRANNYPYPSAGRTLSINTSWKTIASSTTGFNCDVWIASYNLGTIGLVVSPSDIRMLGKSGNVVWQESGAVAGNGAQRQFWCGSDVYTIQIKTQTGTGSAYAYGN